MTQWEYQNTLFQETKNYLLYQRDCLIRFLDDQAPQLENLNTLGDEDYDDIVGKAHLNTINNITAAIEYIDQLCELLEIVKRQKIEDAKRNQPWR
ncbi:MAG: hypothetical protein QNJ63_15125 [Calothrix sp. MO_192.B10]|nr:hypothetical protein [Calothrix sp. MO_192.B10]